MSHPALRSLSAERSLFACYVAWFAYYLCMSTRVISVDLWGTVFNYNSEISVSVRRRELVRLYAAEHGVTDEDLIDEAYYSAAEHFKETYETRAITLTPRERLSYQLESIGIETGGDDFEQLVENVQNAIIENPPPLAPNVREGLKVLAARFPLVLVSDTGFSPGNVIRRIFQDYGLAQFFADYSFSDENGRSKPDPLAFTSVLERVGATPSEFVHIGDTEWSDIKGARNLDGHACLYVGLNDKWLNGTEADFILYDWADVSELMGQIERSQSGVA
jgi:putative hydrolase of the HAD superfamily